MVFVFNFNQIFLNTVWQNHVNPDQISNFVVSEMGMQWLRMNHKRTLSLTLKKRQEENASENVVCWSRLLQKMPNITDESSIEANIVDQEQTAPIGAVWSGSILFVIEAS